MTQRNDEWGLIIKKQLEIDQARALLERKKLKKQQEDYKKQLDALISQKNAQKVSHIHQKSQEINQITSHFHQLSQEEDLKRLQKLEQHRKIIEENLKLQNFNNSQKDQQKFQILEQDKQNNQLDKARHFESMALQKQHRKLLEQEMSKNLKFSLERQEIQKKTENEEKNREFFLAKQEELRFMQRDQDYRDHVNKIRENQMKKMEIFSQNIAPKLVQKEINYQQWVQHAEEVKKLEEQRKVLENERKREVNEKVVAETLKKQAEDREVRKFIRKEEEKAVDDELQRRIEFSVRIDEDRNFRKRVEGISYREELLQQAAADKLRKQNEFKLSQREKNLNKSLLDVEKSSILRGANEIIKATDVNKRTPGLSPSLKSTTLQLSSLVSF
jgi:hypothetical protein